MTTRYLRWWFAKTIIKGDSLRQCHVSFPTERLVGFLFLSKQSEAPQILHMHISLQSFVEILSTEK